MNIGIFPALSTIGIDFCYSLNTVRDFNIIGLQSGKIGRGKTVFKNIVSELPFMTDDEFLNELNSVIINKNISLLFPAFDDVIVYFSKHRDTISCSIAISESYTCEITRSKSKTYHFFKDKIRTPKIYNSSDELIYPVFVKPDKGSSSIDTAIVHNDLELKYWLSKPKEMLIVEYIDGKEYTIDCFTDRFGALKFVGGRERIDVRDGVSVNIKRVRDSRFNTLANIINSHMKFRGAWFFQVKENNNNELVLMEMAPRLAGGTGFYRNQGVNLSVLTVLDFLEVDINSIIDNNLNYTMERLWQNRFTEIDYQNVYVDLDDTLIFKHEVNWILIAFLYQCINKGKNIFLITKYIGCVEDYLNKYKISSGIFNNIITIPHGAKKSNYIVSKSIFIDDSFTERKDVFDTLNIPVFDANCVESLLDWRM